jgi:hypothetical protein
VEYSQVARDLGRLTVLPGRYVARLEVPNEPVREQHVEVAAGAEVRVTFPPP